MAAAALGSWGALFWYLMASDRTSLYLSSRTDWVIPVGAVTLTLVFAGLLLTVRVKEPQPLTRRDVWGIAVVILPVITVLTLPPASLGSFAAARRSSLASGGIVASAEDISSGQLSLSDVAGAVQSSDGGKALLARAGDRVAFVGFVTRDAGQPADEFTLTRFLISCCAADALSIEVRVVGAPPGQFSQDDWVRVEGKMYPLGREVVVDATTVASAVKPKHPYLNP